MKQYRIHFGPKAPYKSVVFSNWTEASRFIKETIDAGKIVHSISKELSTLSSKNERGDLIQSVDIIGDR